MDLKNDKYKHIFLVERQIERYVFVSSKKNEYKKYTAKIRKNYKTLKKHRQDKF